jgi:hypothetical protein
MSECICLKCKNELPNHKCDAHYLFGCNGDCKSCAGVELCSYFQIKGSVINHESHNHPTAIR